MCAFRLAKNGLASHNMAKAVNNFKETVKVDTSSFPTFPPGDFLPGTHIEVRHPDIVRGRIRFVLFDFDGTLSLIREGWQQVMIPMMVELLQQTGTKESPTELEALVSEFVTRLTGKQTIYQMIELAKHIRARGQEPLDPVEYKHLYLQRLWQRICHRVEGLQKGEIPPDDLLVPGARVMLQRLYDAGMQMYLASGTDEPYVISEAQALRIDHFFAGRIYGALDDYQRFSKKKVIEHIIREHQLHGPEFCAFGDGFVEIEDTKAVGGIAVGVASNEDTREGINEWKRNRLIQAGADVIVPDFREAEALLQYLGIDG